MRWHAHFDCNCYLGAMIGEWDNEDNGVDLCKVIKLRD